mgnify:CR=1 FL=1
MWIAIDHPAEAEQAFFSVPLPQGMLVIGRGKECDVIIHDHSLAKIHLRLQRKGHEVTFNDLSQRGDVLLNGVAQDSGKLVEGDKLLVNKLGLQLLARPPRKNFIRKEPSSQRDWGKLLDNLRQAQEPRELLDILLKGLVELCEASRGFVLLREKNESKLVPVASCNVSNTNRLVAVSSTVYNKAIESDKVVFILNSLEDELCEFAESITSAAFMQTIFCAPLSAGGKNYGAIYLDKRYEGESPDEEQLSMFESMTGLAAQLLSATRFREELLDARVRLKALNYQVQDEEKLVLGESEASKELSDLLEQAAPEDVTVLITGETGTGKEMVARAIHRQSPRKNGPFIPVNCAALPSDILEAELFGAEKGAYTGANELRLGRFELASRGTLFLDEIGELPLDVQVKLLRVLQERTITRLGAGKPIPVDFRLICATNADLESAVNEGSFRRDFYYRVNVFRIKLAPLRERTKDILPLARHFLHDFASRYGRSLQGFSNDAACALNAHLWPGNIRELRNAVERAVVVEQGAKVSPESLPVCKMTPQSSGTDKAFWSELPVDYDSAREMFERTFLERSLAAHDGNVSAVAKATGMPRRTIYRRLKALGLLK